MTATPGGSRHGAAAGGWTSGVAVGSRVLGNGRRGVDTRVSEQVDQCELVARRQDDEVDRVAVVIEVGSVQGDP